MSYHRKNEILAGAFFLALTLQTTTAAAQPENGNRWSGPPPEAIEACASLEEGDVCTFTGRRGEDVQGSCMLPPKASGDIACAPDDVHRPRPEEEDQ